jgi:hypothetical protein
MATSVELGPAFIEVPRGAFGRRFTDAVRAADLSAGPGDDRAVAEDDLVGLPEVVRRNLRFMGVVGRPRDWSLRARFAGRFWLRRELGWMAAEARQYNSGLAVARVFALEELEGQRARDYETRMVERAAKEAASGHKMRGAKPSARSARPRRTAPPMSARRC